MRIAFLRLQLPHLRVDSRGWLSVAIVVSVTMMLSVALIRVVVNAQSNYQVYLFEQSALSQLRDKNSELRKQLEYHQSYEYKKLYARDFLHLGEPGEKLYRVAGQSTYYAVAQAEINLLSETKPLDLWQLIW